ncbi:ER membrane protein complex subunit 10-like [Homarus americanus]|uniref:ER membrane protein complex subunit 10 n=1 Tax=Homarus americanus TaxID=6706 RepID=A0A8J5N5I5_HOMAM|nr:ER membrane protein complex subunit 10-like [Homarus americanus]
MLRTAYLCRIIFLSFLAVLATGVHGFQEDEFLDGQLTLVVEDALDGGPNPAFSPRSTIHVRSVKSGNALVTHNRQWTTELENKLRKLAENDDLYRIRVHHKGLEDKGYVSTFTKAIYESGLSETVSMMVDSAGTSVVGVGLIPPVAVCRGEPPEVPPVQHNTTVIIRSPTPAPVPDTATYIEKLEAMKNEKAEGKDNRSFLSKYWMYIVPVVLIMVLFGGGQEGGR